MDSVQATVDANPNIGDVTVEQVQFDEIPSTDDDDADDNNAAIIGGVIGGSVLTLAAVALLITRRRTDPLDDDDESIAPPPATGCGRGFDSQKNDCQCGSRIDRVHCSRESPLTPPAAARIGRGLQLAAVAFCCSKRNQRHARGSGRLR
jgi:hypothetical protein